MKFAQLLYFYGQCFFC